MVSIDSTIAHTCTNMVSIDSTIDSPHMHECARIWRLQSAYRHDRSRLAHFLCSPQFVGSISASLSGPAFVPPSGRSAGSLSRISGWSKFENSANTRIYRRETLVSQAMDNLVFYTLPPPLSLPIPNAIPSLHRVRSHSSFPHAFLSQLPLCICQVRLSIWD